MSFVLLLAAEAMPKLVNDNGTATAIGVWVLMALGAGGGALWIYNQVLTAKVNTKVLHSPMPTQQQIAQPLIVAMEKEFLLKREYDKDKKDWKNQLTEKTTYVHDRIHDFSEAIETITGDAGRRNERLAALESDSKTHTQQLRDLNIKADKIVERVGDKVEQLIREGTIRGGRS